MMASSKLLAVAGVLGTLSLAGCNPAYDGAYGYGGSGYGNYGGSGYGSYGYSGYNTGGYNTGGYNSGYYNDRSYDRSRYSGDSRRRWWRQHRDRD